MYPITHNYPNGKSRYLYEVAQMSYIIEKAGDDTFIYDKYASYHP